MGDQGGLAFDTMSIDRRSDIAATTMTAPPANVSFTQPALPEPTSQMLIEPGELAAFRTAPASDVPAALPDASVLLPPAGLVLVNASDEIRFAWLDGAPVAWLAPGARIVLPSLLRGRYGFAWRTFLGDAYDAPITITVPGAETAHAADAGAP